MAKPSSDSTEVLHNVAAGVADIAVEAGRKAFGREVMATHAGLALQALMPVAPTAYTTHETLGAAVASTQVAALAPTPTPDSPAPQTPARKGIGVRQIKLQS